MSSRPSDACRGRRGVLGVVVEGVAYVRTGAFPVLHGPHPFQIRRHHHEGGVRGVDDLVRRGEPLVDETQQVPLRGGVQAETRLVQEQNGALTVAKLRKGCEKGEEPGETLGALAEVEGDAVALVADADVEEWSVTDAMSVEINVQIDGKERVLTPVAEHFLRDFVGGGFQCRLAGVVVSGVELRKADIGQAQQRECGAFARTEHSLFAVLQPGNGQAPGHHAVFVEVQKAGESVRKNVTHAVADAAIRFHA